MNKKSVIQAIEESERLVFTTREISSMCNIALNSVTQSLARLEKSGMLKKISRGVWARIRDKRFSPYAVIPYLSPSGNSYLSFIGALHIHGVISQIPQVITVASTSHSKKIKTSVGTFQIHQISPDFFFGFEWNKTGEYLIASPEKSLLDCLYLSTRKGNRFANFPELDISLINIKVAKKMAEKIKDTRIRKIVLEKLKEIY